ncbi:MAG: ABC transporter ATP-binding protein [Desulfofustis sp.]|nr:ABC transporter ATP-binding protein [Desulfofustis sp.]
MHILEVKNLIKSYRDVQAVRGVSFVVEEGHCFGLLGPNGAGKTTTMEIIEDILEPTSGTIYYKGAERSRSFREEIGIQFQHTSLLNFLSVRETLACYQQLYRKSADTDWLINKCDLSSILGRKNHKLSGGQRQRLMLALALLNRPDLLFLDEPSTGLDPQSRRYLWSILEEIKKEGKTIILTTHSMEEAEFLCDSIAIMDQGRIIAEGSPEELIATYCNTNTITLPHNTVADQLDCLDMVYKTNGRSVSIQTTHVDTTLGRLISCGVDLSEMTVHSANLEDVFLHLTGRKLRD